MSARNLFLAFILFAEGRNMSNNSTYRETLRMKNKTLYWRKLWDGVR